VVLALLFVISFGIMVAISIKSLSGEIAFSKIIDRAGGAFVAIFTGFVISGTIVMALGLASGSNTFPYERFSSARPDVGNPRGAILNPDGFVAGLFGFVSDGSFAGTNSFAALHASFNDAIAMDRLAAEKKVSPLAGKSIIQPPVAIRLAPAGIVGADGKRLPETPGGSEFILVRLNLTKNAIGRESPNFLLGQLRIVCTDRNARGKPGEGSGTCIYPIGYMKTPTTLLLEPASAMVPLADAELESGVKAVDFAFYLPVGTKPSLIAFKRNFIMPAPTIAEPKEAPAPIGFDKPKEDVTSSRRPSQQPRDPNSAG
jgi:hypothetical protein